MKNIGNQKIQSQGLKGLRAWKGSWWRIVTTCLSLALGVQAAASTDEDWKDALDTDRPDLANSSHVLEAGTFQVESGLTRTADPATTTVSLPILFRLGLVKGWEARVETAGPQWANAGGAGEAWSGFQDLGVGAKWNFLNEEGRTLEGLGFIGEVTWRDLGLGLTLAEATLTLAVDLDLPGETSLGINLGFAQEDPSGLNQGQWTGAASFGFPLASRWSAYLEGSGILPATGAGTVGIDGGLKLLLSPDAQLDGSAGRFWVGANVQTTLSLGLSLRFGPRTEKTKD